MTNIFSRTPLNLDNMIRENEALVAKLDNQLAQLALSGDDEKSAMVRLQCDEAKAKVVEFKRAKGMADDQEKMEQDRVRNDRHVKNLMAVDKAGVKVVAAANKVDKSLTALDKEHTGLKLAILDLGMAQRKAGVSDGNRLDRTIKHATRWASYHSAPMFSEDAQIARTEMNKRRPLAEALAVTIPSYSKEMV